MDKTENIPLIATETTDLIPSHTRAATPFIVSHAPDQSPLINCITALIIPSTALIAVEITSLMASQAVVIMIFIDSQATCRYGPSTVIIVCITVNIPFQTVEAV